MCVIVVVWFMWWLGEMISGWMLFLLCSMVLIMWLWCINGV